MKGVTARETVNLILEMFLPFSTGAEHKAGLQAICAWVWVPACAREQRLVIFADTRWLNSNAQDLWETPFTVHGSGIQNGWVNFSGTKILDFLWHFPESLEKFLRCSYLLERHCRLPAKDAESCLCSLKKLQLPSLPGVQKNHIPSCWECSWPPCRTAGDLKPRVGLTAFPLKCIMWKKLRLQLINSAVSGKDVLFAFSHDSVFLTLPEVHSLLH